MKIHARHTCANIAHIPAAANHAVIVRCVASGAGPARPLRQARAARGMPSADVAPAKMSVRPMSVSTGFPDW